MAQMVAKSPLFRQWMLLRAIDARNGEATVKTLVDATGVSEKTIRRDLALLRRVGFPLDERTGDFGRRTFTLAVKSPALEFNFDEALALYLCRRTAIGFAGTFVEQSLQAPLSKIEAPLGRGAAKYVDTMLTLHPSPILEGGTSQMKVSSMWPRSDDRGKLKFAPLKACTNSASMWPRELLRRK